MKPSKSSHVETKTTITETINGQAKFGTEAQPN
jgi:hypothetical protein